MQCPVCNTVNRDGAAFCGGCGGVLGQAPVLEPEVREDPTIIAPQPEIPTGTLVPCPRCGAAMSATTRRCTACDYGSIAATPVDDDRGRPVAIITVVASIVAVISLLAALYVWRTSGDAATAESNEPQDRTAATAELILDTEPATTTAPPTATAISVAPPATASLTATTTPTVPPTTQPITQATAPPTAPSSTAPPVTATPTTTSPPPPTTVPGDLDISGYTMTRPECDGAYIVSVGSYPPDDTGHIRDALVRFPGTNYLRTDQTCPSLRATFPDNAGTWAGKPIYMVVFGPYPLLQDACNQQTEARGLQPDAYTKVLEPTDDAINENPCE